MFSRQLRLFALLAVFVALAQANWFDDSIFHRRAALPQKKDLLSDVGSAGTSILGGLLGTGAGTTSATSSASVKSTSAKTTTTPTPTPTPTPSSSSTTPTPTSSSTQDVTSSSTSPPSSNTPTPTPTPTPTESSSVSVGATTVVTTVDGNPVTTTSSYTTSASKPTNSAGLSQNQTSSSSMSSKTKSTVIGVVCGVGGAIVLVGLAIVAWRIWGRKKNEDESDGLMGFRSGSAGHEKSGSVSGAGSTANPFQSTLENYHNPAKNVNASSNF